MMNFRQRQMIKEAYKEGYESALNENVVKWIRRLLGMDDVPPRAGGVRQTPVDTGTDDVIVDPDVIITPKLGRPKKPRDELARPPSNEPGRLISRSIKRKNAKDAKPGLDTPIGADNPSPDELDIPIDDPKLIDDVIDRLKKQIDDPDDIDLDTPIG